MIFNSLEFVVFLLIVLPVYYCLRTRAQNVFLIAASYAFYGWWDYRFLTLILVSTLVDYFAAGRIERASGDGARKGYLLLSLCTNLGILGFFKYFNFFLGSFSALSQRLGLGELPWALEIVLPVGISFYTFQTLAYTIDVYRGKTRATSDFISFALYVCYFPQLVAGPIERAQHLLPILRKKRTVDGAMIRSGLQLVLLGYVKKVAIADQVAPWVAEIFGAPEAQSNMNLLLGVYLFAIQIYCDFSGYSDIARGVSKWMGIELMVNFRQPYLSANIQEFWRRWHISLSTWLRDYLYIPLGGNRLGTARTYCNLMLTMLLGGLWHGANWTFVVWGLLHGLYLGVHRAFSGRAPESLLEASVFKRVLLAVATFHLVCLSWIFFRSPDFHVACQYLSGLVSLGGAFAPDTSLARGLFFYAFLLLAIDIPMAWGKSEVPLPERPGRSILRDLRAAAVFAALILILSFVGENHGEQPFIYFQF